MPALLLAVHAFFEALGADEIRRRGGRDDKPLRMVKVGSVVWVCVGGWRGRSMQCF